LCSKFNYTVHRSTRLLDNIVYALNQTLGLDKSKLGNRRDSRFSGMFCDFILCIAAEFLTGCTITPKNVIDMKSQKDTLIVR
jgi:hypothetical protein